MVWEGGRRRGMGDVFGVIGDVGPMSRVGRGYDTVLEVVWVILKGLLLYIVRKRRVLEETTLMRQNAHYWLAFPPGAKVCTLA